MRAIIFTLFLCLITTKIVANPVIKVGGYLFPPFVEINNGEISGLTLELIKLLNSQQSNYNFEFVITSPKRRYIDFEKSKIDALFFESKKWGWVNHPIDASVSFLSGGEVYITKNGVDKSQDYFENLQSKSMAGILGYHYWFAGFNADEEFLKKHYKIELFNNPSTILNQVLSERIQIGIVTQSYLARELVNKPQYTEKLLVSDKLDQVYSHTLLIRKSSPVTVKTMNSIINKIQMNGTLDTLFLRYGLTSNSFAL
jgi:polar amino acid transport system substrate-binding protein